MSTAEVFEKFPDEVKDYDVDWSDELGADTISTSTWTVPSGITQDSESETTTVATIWVSGGTAGQSYTLENEIVTAGGRTLEAYIVIKVVDITAISTAYADNEDVEAYIVDTYTSPTSGQVDAWCVQLSARVNAILTRNGYATVPATGTNDLELLRGMVSMGVAALVGNVIYGTDDPQVVAWRETWQSFLTELKDGEMMLVDQSPTSTIGVSLPAVYGYND